MDETPSNTTETCKWDDHTWYYCALCKQCHGGWSPSHSTKGDTDKGIAAHHSSKPVAKRNSADSNLTPTKKTCFTTDRSTKFCTMQASFASKGKPLQELLKSLQQATDNDNKS
jgi:hypothetical protein